MQEPGQFHSGASPRPARAERGNRVRMALSAKLQLRQSQSLVMTPQLMQSIRLLQLGHAELERFIEAEIEKNPLLERASDDGAAPEPETASGEDGGDWSAQAMSDRLDTSLENVFPDDPGRSDAIAPDLAAQWKSASPGRTAGGGEMPGIEETTAAPVTLADHLAAQIALTFADAADRLIATELAGTLSEAGYLEADTAELADRLGVTEERVETVLARCQTLDPAGAFARDLAECLALQLEARDRLDPAMAALIAHLDLLARRDFAALRRFCGVDDEDLVDMLAEIRTLDPKPGAAFASATADPVVPDVLVSPAPDGSWAVELNSETLPRVLVDQTYHSRIAGAARGAAEREFLSECLQNANWLTRSLDQRARTILKVAGEIVRQQDAFLTHGVRHLKPLTLRMVADAIGMHESTVSRVTANKYVLTPRGVFELRFFFTSAIASAEGGEAHSAEAVRDRIRELVDGETPVDVLSDDTIVDILRKSGVDIARRTVAKYREGMNIPSSVQRRREKRAGMARSR